jgi:predicted DNA-binding transcriptional regulator YafY
MRASRLVRLLLLLQARGQMTAPELAAELEVSVRTVYRDVESLSAAGVPVYADRGPAGGYRLLDGYRTRLTGLTASEAASLFLAGAPGPAAELGLGTMLAAAELKLLAALPPEFRARAAGVRERFHLDAPGWFRETDEVPWLCAIADAVWDQRRLRIRYERWGPEEVTRTLEPLGLVLKAGTWYLVASPAGETGAAGPEGTAVHAAIPAGARAREPAAAGPAGAAGLARRVRSYRVTRIRRLDLLPQRFERPGGFDLAGWWQANSRELAWRLFRGEAVVRLSPRGRELLPVLLGAAQARAASDSAGPPDAGGWSRVVVPIESIDHGVADFLRLGAEAEVLAPRELRLRIAGAVHALACIYPPPT